MKGIYLLARGVGMGLDNHSWVIANRMFCSNELSQ